MTSLVALIKQLDKKILLAVSGIVAIAIVAGGAYAIGAARGSGSPAAEAPSPKDRVGGLDLAKYCESYGYSEVDTQFCTAPIDLDGACQWQYNKADLKMVIQVDEPYGGKCRDKQKKDVGGIKDMLGYCNDTYQGSINVQPLVLNGKTWVCRAPINKNLACGWQYQTESLAAVEESAGLWACYKP
ncbi:hypothetical protein AB0J83_38990 [Actinoplanes sp. NPDC049596]|uniref:hypothetical protein n=1 Tax=unclassified Actinoplanes TaxID=2626549 RepID=UPI003429E5CB